mgnify:CR=1 FL=1
MSKGRLEEIRKNVLTSEFDLFGNTYISMPKENFDWLITRVEELENEIENWQKGRFLAVSTIVKERDLKKRVYELEKQIKRYREVLKGILKILNSEDWTMYDAAALQDNIDDYLTLENGDLLEDDDD